MSFSLSGMNIVVTGCATGIGQGIALGLCKAGAAILALDIADLSKTCRLVEQAGGTCRPYRVDLSDSAQIDAVWNRAVEENGHIDALFNNAGMQHRESVLTYPEAVLDKILAVNFKSAYLLSQKAANHFKSRGYRGKIVNTASLFSTFGGVNVSGYTCSKGAILSLTRALSNELAPNGICVNAIAPGYIHTELTQSIYEDPQKRRPMDERIPLGRWGTPEDFEGVAVFLASPASDYITGAMIPVDGGYIAGSEDRKRVVREAVARHGRIDVLVNNAGVAPKERRDLLEMTEESFDRVVGTNTKGNMFMTQEVARHMIATPCASQTRGVIVNISSCSAEVSSVSRGEYCVSKAGISMLTRLYADRLAGEGIRVYEVRPGVIRTDMTSGVAAKYDSLIEGGLFPIARWGTPQDVARAVRAFCSEDFAYTTGNFIDVDGGFHIRRL